MGVDAGYRMPKVKLKNPKIEGGLEALDAAGCRRSRFGGTIAMGAYLALSFSMQIVGKIQLLIATAEAGIGAEITALLNLELGADVNGRFEQGKGARLKIDPFVARVARPDRVADRHAARVDLLVHHHRQEVHARRRRASRTSTSAPSGRSSQSSCRSAAPAARTSSAGCISATDATDAHGGRRQGGLQEGLGRRGQQRGEAEARAGVEEHASRGGAVRESAPKAGRTAWSPRRSTSTRCSASTATRGTSIASTPTTPRRSIPRMRARRRRRSWPRRWRMASKNNPQFAGRIVLEWRRAQIAHMGVNPDTGVNVSNEREEVQALIAEKFAAESGGGAAQAEGAGRGARAARRQAARRLAQGGAGAPPQDRDAEGRARVQGQAPRGRGQKGAEAGRRRGEAGGQGRRAGEAEGVGQGAASASAAGSRRCRRRWPSRRRFRCRRRCRCRRR